MGFVREIFAEFSKDKCTTLAAALAYYTAFALPPLLYLLLALLTFGLSVAYDSDQAEQQAKSALKSQVSQMMGNPQASDQISKILENSEREPGRWWKTLLSVAGIIVGATGVVAALQTSLNQVWGVKPDPERSSILEMARKRLLSFGMILGLGFLLVVSLIASAVLNGLSEMIGASGTLGEAINFAVQAIVVFVMFAAIFKYMPDAKVQWSDVMRGTAITTVLFLIGRFALQLYFSHSQPAAHLGAAAASFAVLLVWVYYIAIIVLLGAEATQVHAVRYGSGIQPEPHAVKVVEKIDRTDE